jgi:hypothetical protein
LADAGEDGRSPNISVPRWVAVVAVVVLVGLVALAAYLLGARSDSHKTVAASSTSVGTSPQTTTTRAPSATTTAVATTLATTSTTNAVPALTVARYGSYSVDVPSGWTPKLENFATGYKRTWYDPARPTAEVVLATGAEEGSWLNPDGSLDAAAAINSSSEGAVPGIPRYIQENSYELLFSAPAPPGMSSDGVWFANTISGAQGDGEYVELRVDVPTSRHALATRIINAFIDQYKQLARSTPPPPSTCVVIPSPGCD